ncbi:hypothetical protein [Lactococcus sp. NH2-7C]|uniref:Rgg family transcriptional regulator n=1 Tax=Lactococcus TaxID=1357 RepID=UPI001CDC1E0B|nr:hypothetical protein [Lactococcus sp. NH2-7C]MCA2390923.1 hypothetical protein [Lactococcus sp. NH2-7C]WGV29726.1 hypothetical protein QJV49_09345 [Lactococcus sp. NH2-7C]
MIKNTSSSNNLGPFFRKLRIAKGFTIKEAAGDAMSPKHLANFETSRTNLSAHLFFSALANINVTAFEFQNDYNQFIYEKDITLFSSTISEAFLVHNVVELKNLLHKLQSNENNSKKMELEKIRCKAVISYLDPSYVVPNEEVRYLRNYLSSLKEWGYYEILLFSDCVPLFELLTLSKFIHSIIMPTQTNFNLVYIKQVRIQAILNCIQYFIKNNQITLAEEFITYLENTDIHEYWTFEKIILRFNRYLLEYKKGNEKAMLDMKKLQDLLEISGSFKLANEISDRIKTLD